MTKKIKNKAQLIVIAVIVLVFAAIGVIEKDALLQYASEPKTEEGAVQTGVTAQENETIPVENLQVHYIDVGQADSILVMQNGHAMLIDGGNRDDGELVVSYLKEKGVTKLDYVIATHPHEDHIGGLDQVIENFPIETMLLPDKTHTTKTFEDMLLAMKKKGLSKTIPKVGDTYSLGESSFTIMAPNSNDYGDNLNNYSIVIKLTYQKNSFLMMGDAEITSEKEMMEKGLDLSCDVLKIGHHGSKTSSSHQFLASVHPAAAVISVGKGNDYGLPKKEVMNRLKTMKIPVYRTDEQGTIIAISDGTHITFSKEPGSYQYVK